MRMIAAQQCADHAGDAHAQNCCHLLLSTAPQKHNLRCTKQNLREYHTICTGTLICAVWAQIICVSACACARAWAFMRTIAALVLQCARSVRGGACLRECVQFAAISVRLAVAGEHTGQQRVSTCAGPSKNPSRPPPTCLRPPAPCIITLMTHVNLLHPGTHSSKPVPTLSTNAIWMHQHACTAE